MIDWQTVTVGLIILGALVYTGRRAWSRLQSFRARKSVEASCETGCGSCGSNQKAQTTPRTVLVEIGRIRSKK